MRRPEETAALRQKLIDQIEAAHATADEMGDAGGLRQLPGTPHYFLLQRADP